VLSAVRIGDGRVRSRNPPVVLRTQLDGKRSKHGIVHCPIDVKFWLSSTPTVEQARPACCPHCGRAGHPVGGLVGLVGHGVRQRQLRGPLEPGPRSAVVILVVRRYRCRWCRHTVTVVPRGVVALRHYGGYAIAAAFWMYGMGNQSIEQTRDVIGAGDRCEAGWPSLGRWADAVASGQMFRGVRAPPWRSQAPCWRGSSTTPGSSNTARIRCSCIGRTGPDRRLEAKVPRDLPLRTKPEIALDIIDRALADGIPLTPVVVDSGYGDNGPFRATLDRLGLQYIAQIKGKTTVLVATTRAARR